jgi:hypothetical protein
VLLDKQKGYTDLLRLVEQTWKGKLNTAAIYMREPGQEKFNKLCRRWYLGELEECDDPGTDQLQNQKLYYWFENYRLRLSFDQPAAIDFKEEIAKRLQ